MLPEKAVVGPWGYREVLKAEYAGEALARGGRLEVQAVLGGAYPCEAFAAWIEGDTFEEGWARGENPPLGVPEDWMPNACGLEIPELAAMPYWEEWAPYATGRADDESDTMVDVDNKVAEEGVVIAGVAEGLLNVELVDNSGIDEPVPSLEPLLDAIVETVV